MMVERRYKSPANEKLKVNKKLFETKQQSKHKQTRVKIISILLILMKPPNYKANFVFKMKHKKA